MKNNIERSNLNNFLINEGQNEVGPCMIEFANSIGKIESINDFTIMWKKYMKEILRDKENKVPKFERTSEEIFKEKIWSGCSDVGTSFAPILRMKGIPTIYLQSASINWIKDLNENNKDARMVKGHIFLEIYLNNEWLLFDPTNGYIYLGYDYNNFSLPNSYYVFSKSLNGHELGHTTLKDNNEIMKKIFLNFDISSYNEPNYEKIDLNKL